MISTYKHKDITWLDLENPTQDEVRTIAEKYGLDPIVANDLLTPTSLPVVDPHSEYIYLILHFPVTTRDGGGFITEVQEIDFILGKDFIITNRYTSIDALSEFAKTFTVHSILEKNNMSEHAGYLFYYIVKNLYKELADRLNHVNDLLKDSEDKIFGGKEKDMVIELSKLNRLLLQFKSSIAIHDEILKDLEPAVINLYGDNFKRYIRSTYAEYIKASSHITALKDYLGELRGTNDSLLSTKQNEIMKNLTVMTFVMLPLSLIASVFGMNAVNMPFIGQSFDFYIIIALMGLITGGIFLFFRFTKWL